jgi:hypothetical protein
MWLYVKLSSSYSQESNCNSRSSEGIVGNIEIDSEAEIYCTQCFNKQQQSSMFGLAIATVVLVLN